MPKWRLVPISEPQSLWDFRSRFEVSLHCATASWRYSRFSEESSPPHVYTCWIPQATSPVLDFQSQAFRATGSSLPIPVNAEERLVFRTMSCKLCVPPLSVTSVESKWNGVNWSSWLIASAPTVQQASLSRELLSLSVKHVPSFLPASTLLVFSLRQ